MTNENEIKKLTPFKLCILQNFPFIEEDFDAITNYQLLCKVVEYLNNVIKNENDLNEQMTSLYNSFVEFQNYVTNYLDNLNIQNEVNNKLDEMASDGTLENLINDKLHLTKTYATYTEMINDSNNFTNGLKIKILGYHELNDGGQSEYYVNDTIIADNYQIELENGLYLNLNNNYREVYPEMFGAYGNNNNDDSTALVNAFNYAVGHKATLILNKNYNVTNNITLNGNAQTIDIICNGNIKPTAQITITNIINSNLKIKLNGGGNLDSSEYAVILSKLKYCQCDLIAENVKKTAFYVYSSRTAQSTCNFCTLKVKGNNNTKTLLHGVLGYTVPDNGAFGSYEDIEDHNPSEPITFRSSSDVTIMHFENEFNDGTHQKNSLEFLYCGIIHCSNVACGANAKNLIYSLSSRVFIDNVFVLAEDKTDGQINIPSVVTGVFASGLGSIKINNITNHGCKYAIDMSELNDQACKDSYIYNVYNVYDENVSGRTGGIYCPKISNDIMFTYNNLDKGVINYSDYLTFHENMNINNSTIVKNDNQVNIHIDFNVDNSNIGQNTTIIYINTSLLKEPLDSSGLIFDKTNNSIKGIATLNYNSFQIKTQTSLISGNRYDLNISFYVKKSKLQQL